MKTKLILIIDDDPDIHSLVSAFLKHEGYQASHAFNASKALELLAAEEPDLILLDVHMPDMDGITLCKNIRMHYQRPILFVSGTGKQEEIAKSLQSGGDDYIRKPFDPQELMLRVKANLRWGSMLPKTDAQTESPKTLLEFPGLQINLERKSVLLNNQPVPLLAKEWQLLVLMAQHPNRVFHPEQLYRQIWETDVNYSKDIIKAHISNLRKKIEPHSALKKYIITVDRLGYKFNPYGVVEQE